MKKHIIILGAGISGLATVWNLKKKHPDIRLTVIEKSSRAGGWIQTIEKEGFLFEQGPRSCRSSGTGLATLQLIEELGLEDQVIVADPVASTRYLYFNHSLKKFPWGLTSLAHKILPALWRDWRAPSAQQDESIRDFISRRLDPAFADYLMDPLTSGIYAGDISKLSIQSCFPLLHSWEDHKGSLIRGAWHQRKNKAPVDDRSDFVKKIQKSPLFSLKGGMESLIKELVNQLGVTIHYNSECDKIEERPEGMIVVLADGTRLDADQVISTLPSKDLHYASVVVVNLGYRHSVLPKSGFGYLIPSNQKESILGCVWDSSVFPQQNRFDETRLTVMMGGVHHPEVSNESPEKIEKMALEALRNHMGIVDSPDAIAIKIARCAIPQYEVGHLNWVQQVQSGLSQNNRWIGTAFNGVSVNDCIAKAVYGLYTQHVSI
jgi:protoporphyrinogen/coproporphyrinogen III oxidase